MMRPDKRMIDAMADIIKSFARDRDWPEDYNQENGMYLNVCVRCDFTFKGHKHRRICKKCAD